MRRRRAAGPANLLQLEDTFSSLVGKASRKGLQALTTMEEMVDTLPFDLDVAQLVSQGQDLDLGTNGPEMWEELERYAKELQRLCRETAALNKLVVDAHKELSLLERRNQWRD